MAGKKISALDAFNGTKRTAVLPMESVASASDAKKITRDALFGTDCTTTADTQFVSGEGCAASAAYASSMGFYNTSSGVAAAAFGVGCSAGGERSFTANQAGQSLGENSSVFGSYPVANNHSEQAISGGLFLVSGDAQNSTFFLRGSTTNATPAALALPAAGFLVPAEFVIGVLVTVTAIDTAGNAAYLVRQAAVKNLAGTTALVGTVGTVGADKVDAGLAGIAATVTANDTTDSIDITVTGLAATDIRWHAVLTLNQLKHG